MIGLAAASMTTPVQYRYLDVEATAAATAREQFNGAVTVGSDWEVTAVRRIFELERLPANWDGYGSLPPSRRTCVRALNLVAQLARFSLDRLPLPHVAAAANDGIVFEFAGGQRELAFSLVGEDDRVRYLRSESGEPFEEGVLSAGRLRELVSWLISSSV
jgi:hypothetical protein